MNTLHFQTLASKSPPFTTIPNLVKLSRTIHETQIFLTKTNIYHRPRSINSTTRINSNSTDGNDTPSPPEMEGIRFRRGARRRRQQRDEKQTSRDKAAATTTTTPKKWDDMSFNEKALELYVGEKGLLFWLNKFAYASIFIIIGAWILFRFVGPALNLYQLDSPPLSPTSILKGS